MLSISNLTDSVGAGHYFEQDEYYTKEGEHKNESGQWFGKGAQELRLEGNIDKIDFRKVLDGDLPNGISLAIKKNGETVHAPGIDMTFSAPKSVSIMFEVGGDKRILEKHEQAIKYALGWTEKNVVKTRTKSEGKISYAKVDNVTAALFTHHTSRNLDPQLHTHCVVANAVKRNDEQWKTAYLKGVYDNKMFIGQLYRTELAKGMTEIGYNITPTHSDGRFELAEVPKDLIEQFSTRSKEIREVLKQYNFDNAKTAANATLRTRKAKTRESADDLKRVWKDTVKEFGFNTEKVIVNTQKEHTPTTNINKEKKFISFMDKIISNLSKEKESDTAFNLAGYIKDLKEGANIEKVAVKYALSHLSERSSVFDEKQISSHAMFFGLGRISHKDIENEIIRLKGEGYILPSKLSEGQQALITTRDSLKMEQRTIDLMNYGKGSVKQIVKDEKVVPIINKTTMNHSQKQAAKHILTSTDRIIGIQGYAGVGKTYMLGEVNKIATSRGYNLIGLAPSASAAQTLEKDANIKSETIHRFLFANEKILDNKASLNERQYVRAKYNKSIVVLDESSLASTDMVNKLLNLSDKLKFRVVLVGDTKQLGAVEAGKPFAQLQKHKMAVSVMDNIIRQKNIELKDAVYSSIQGRIKSAFDKIGGNIHEATKDNSIEKIASQLWLSHKDRNNTLVLAPSNKSRQSINKIIRSELQKEGIVDKSQIVGSKLESKKLTKAELTHVGNFKKGDVVLFNRDNGSLGLKKNSYHKVISVNPENNTITIESAKGKQATLNPSQIITDKKISFDVFEQQELKYAVGDRVVWKRNNKDLGIINSEISVVTSIDKGNITLQAENNPSRIHSFNSKDMAGQHIDYAYATTVHSAQGKTSENVIAVADSKDKFLTSQSTFYVEISRAKNEAFLVVDDKQKVAERLEKNSGYRVSAIESQYEKEENYKPERIERNNPIKDSIDRIVSLFESDKSPVNINNIEIQRDEMSV